MDGWRWLSFCGITWRHYVPQVVRRGNVGDLWDYYSIRNGGKSDTASVRHCENVPLYLRILTKYTALSRLR